MYNNNNKNNNGGIINKKLENEKEINGFNCIFNSIFKLRKELNYNYISNRVQTAKAEQCVGTWKEIWLNTWRNRLLKYKHDLRQIILNKNMEYAFVDINEKYNTIRNRKQHVYYVLDHETNKIKTIIIPDNAKIELKISFNTNDIDMITFSDKMSIATIIAKIKYGWDVNMNLGKLYHDI